jgi:hypothetical protein
MFVLAAPTFTIDQQDENFHDDNISISAALTTGTTNSLTIKLGNPVTGEEAAGLEGNWTINHYNNVALVVNEGTFIDTNFIINPNAGAPANITISGNGGLLELGIIDGTVGVTSVQTLGGSIVDTYKGYLQLGVADASVVDASAGGGLDIEDPGSWLGIYSATGSSVAGVGNSLQGTLGSLTGLGHNAFGAFIGTTSALATTLTGGNDFVPTGNGGNGAGGDLFYTTGSPTTINLNNASGGDVRPVHDEQRS